MRLRKASKRCKPKETRFRTLILLFNPWLSSLDFSHISSCFVCSSTSVRWYRQLSRFLPHGKRYISGSILSILPTAPRRARRPGYRGKTGALHRASKRSGATVKAFRSRRWFSAGVFPSKKPDGIRWFSGVGEYLSGSGILPDCHLLSVDSDSGDEPGPPYH